MKENLQQFQQDNPENDPVKQKLEERFQRNEEQLKKNEEVLEALQKVQDKINKEEIPEAYQQAVNSNILSDIEYKLGKIKYDDKILHRSRVLRFYTEEGTPIQKSQKDLNNIYKKIKRNKKRFKKNTETLLRTSLINAIMNGIKYAARLNKNINNCKKAMLMNLI